MRILFLLFLLIGFSSVLEAAVGEKDPIKDTQTDPVPVTEELLKQEGQSGPASPSFKLKDSGDFFASEPYETDEELGEIKEEKRKEGAGLEDDWLFWEKDKENAEESESEPLKEE